MKTNVLDYLEDSVKNNPEKAAFVDECKTYTYMDLKNYGQAIGSKIAEYKLF